MRGFHGDMCLFCNRKFDWGGDERKEEHLAWHEELGQVVPSWLCECGCGEETALATSGPAQGKPNRYVQGHGGVREGYVCTEETRQKIRNALGTQEQNHAWKGDEVGYGGLHSWLRKHKTKTGTCEHCGESPDPIIVQRSGSTSTRASTQWANVSGEYRRDLDDFIELCTRCHRKFDAK